MPAIPRAAVAYARVAEVQMAQHCWGSARVGSSYSVAMSAGRVNIMNRTAYFFDDGGYAGEFHDTLSAIVSRCLYDSSLEA